MGIGRYPAPDRKLSLLRFQTSRTRRRFRRRGASRIEPGDPFKQRPNSRDSLGHSNSGIPRTQAEVASSISDLYPRVKIQNTTEPDKLPVLKRVHKLLHISIKP